MSEHLDRRRLLAGGALAATAALIAPPMVRAAIPTQEAVAAQTAWEPLPPQVPVKESMIDVGDAKLWCWDTGGTGEPIVFLHPATGSAAIWGYQQPVFAKAGYRVVAYSRRGHHKSEAGPADNPGFGAADLAAVAEALKLGPFHLVGVAAGGFLVPDFALSYPDRLLSMTIACSLGGVTDPAFREVSTAMTSNGFRGMSSPMRELGPSYRAGNPEGAKLWEELEHTARPTAISQRPQNSLTWDNIAKIRTPTLLMTGGADMFMPPSRMRDAARRFPGAELVIVAESGHAIYWEQPLAFNAALLDFIGRHRQAAR